LALPLVVVDNQIHAVGPLWLEYADRWRPAHPQAQ